MAVKILLEKARKIVQALESPRFIRKTQLGAGEYHKNFQKLDVDVIQVVSSAEADKITPLMSKIYLRLTLAPAPYWERDGVLRFEAEWREGKHVTAWVALCEVLGVASATARKALAWMHEVGVIGYFSGKNGAGLRIFLNRAASSIGKKPSQGTEKILQFSPASRNNARASANEVAFKDSFAVLEVSDTDKNPRAPKSGADTQTVDKTSPEPAPDTRTASRSSAEPSTKSPQAPNMFTLDPIVARLKAELEPVLHAAARQTAAREYERTREWLENRGLPKAARVAQHEAYNVLRKYGLIGESGRSPGAQTEVGRSHYTPPAPHALSPEEVTDMAGVCVAMLETRGQSIELTLSEMSVEAGGYLLPEDAGKVREKAHALLSARSREGN